MKKVIGIIVIILMIPVIISIIGDIDRIPVYPTTEFNIEKLTRIISLDIGNNDIELPKLPNGVGNRIFRVGDSLNNSEWFYEKNVEKVILNGSEDFVTQITYDETVLFYYAIDNIKMTTYPQQLHVMNDFFTNVRYEDIYNNREEGIASRSDQKGLVVGIKKSRIPDWNDSWTSVQKANAFKQWLQANPITVYYQLETPIIENAPTFSEFIDFYDGGSVIVDDGIIDYTVIGNKAQINYIEGNITTVVDGQFKISKPTKIISKSNDLYDYDLSTLPNYLEYGTLTTGTYDNILEFIDINQNKQIKLFFNDNIQESRYNAYLENDTIIINNDTEVIRIYNNDTYTSTRNLDTDITYKLEGYNILEYIDGEFDNTVLAFFWIIPVLLTGGLIYLLLKRKE